MSDVNPINLELNSLLDTSSANIDPTSSTPCSDAVKGATSLPELENMLEIIENATQKSGAGNHQQTVQSINGIREMINQGESLSTIKAQFS